MTRAIQVTKTGDDVQVVLRTDVNDDELGSATADDASSSAEDVVVDIEYSGVNYKDGLALAGGAGVMRISPLIPGIDLVGTVADSNSPDWSIGDSVILNGWGIGETHNGGLAERARVRSEWLILRPDAISPRQAAAIGTAGFTAALAVRALERAGLTPDAGEVLVTGASGGVGSIAIALLAKAGFRVIASTGRATHRDYLLGLGAAGTIDRTDLEAAGRPLQKQRWAGVIDSVGGHTLANVLAQTRWGGAVASCGLVGSSDLPTTVMPFILRGVSLLGINSVECPLPEREAAWGRLEHSLDRDLLDSLTTSVSLEGAIGAGAAILRGELRGRTVVDVRL
ncbi:MAG TPA: MDR family oxidoreductase [Galbitalea sp.]|jgi:acrylyl-CoA reductase (NADPH)